MFLRTERSKAAYHLYLQSEQWQNRRRGALRRAGHKCAFCGTSEKLNVHHVTYDHVGREWAEDLRVLCEPCHLNHHATGQQREIPQTEREKGMGRGKHLCEAKTRRGSKCPTRTNAFDSVSQRWLCHVHHPNLTYAKKVRVKRRKRAQIREYLDSIGAPKPKKKHRQKWLNGEPLF